MDSIFSSSVNARLRKLEILNIDRLGAEAVPRLMFEKGIRMGPFMIDVTKAAREERVMKALRKLKQTVTSACMIDDEWLLSCRYTFSRSEAEGIGLSFVVNLDYKLHRMMGLYGCEWCHEPGRQPSLKRKEKCQRA
ncbi:unnamed protein product [Brugia pahangi]|uniref:DUF4743 domain-containing protein n=1 Tax=Brugia pahangi TaxID=6280 RepID=A0A0N4SXA1_BRUPA|nr:unnamed protein product [Brugia pahangi]